MSKIKVLVTGIIPEAGLSELRKKILMLLMIQKLKLVNGY